MANSKLFEPFQLGDLSLKHRVVMAPLGRRRADTNHVPTRLMEEYYAQRASTPGTLIIAEATAIVPQAASVTHAPSIFTDEQIAGWRKITDTIHRHGSFVYMQLWAAGRALSDEVQETRGYPLISSSDIPLSGTAIKPRSLTLEEITEWVGHFATAAKNAIRAGFDGVEIHGAHGYLVDQFIQDNANRRTDEYGGSIERRCRFALEVVDAVVKAVGPAKTALRLSPWSEYGDMRMPDPRPTFTYLVAELVKRHSKLAYLHLVEPRVSGVEDREVLQDESNDFLRELWAPRTMISAGGYDRESAIEAADSTGALIAFGRLFISNPDLPVRLEKNIPAHKGNRDTYYTPENPTGYVDYPFADGAIAPTRYKRTKSMPHDSVFHKASM